MYIIWEREIWTHAARVLWWDLCVHHICRIFIDKSLTAFKNIVLIDLLFPFNTHTNISTLYHCTLYSTNRPSFFCCTFVWFRMQTHAAFMHQSRLSLSLSLFFGLFIFGLSFFLSYCSNFPWSITMLFNHVSYDKGIGPIIEFPYINMVKSKNTKSCRYLTLTWRGTQMPKTMGTHRKRWNYYNVNQYYDTLNEKRPRHNDIFVDHYFVAQKMHFTRRHRICIYASSAHSVFHFYWNGAKCNAAKHMFWYDWKIIENWLGDSHSMMQYKKLQICFYWIEM